MYKRIYIHFAGGAEQFYDTARLRRRRLRMRLHAPASLSLSCVRCDSVWCVTRITVGNFAHVKSETRANTYGANAAGHRRRRR